MCLNVYLQMFRSIKSLLTNSTLEFLQFGMDELVLFQNWFQMEFLVTDGTFVLFFLMMHKYVTTDCWGLWKYFSTGQSKLLKVFTFKWMYWWAFKWESWANHWLQVGHSCNFSPVCVSMCWSYFSFSAKILSLQSSHRICLFSSWILMWVVRLDLFLYCFGHCIHE